MQLSGHFTLAELTVSANAARLGLSNQPPPEIIDRLRATAAQLERVRSILGGHPLIITSGYRSAEVNRAAKGAKSSAHLSGYAVDFTCPGFGSPLEVARRINVAGVPHDQLIHEFGRWVHLSVDPRMRGELLTIDGQGSRPGLLEVRP